MVYKFYGFVLSCVCYVFVRVCLYVLCGHLLGKGWPLGSRLWCLLWVCHFLIGILGQVWYLIVSILDLCTLTYFYYMPFSFYIVKLPLALVNMFHWTESILAQSHDDAKNPHWGINVDFWHCLIVMTFRNRALFLVLYRWWIVIDDQSKISFDSTNRLCLVIIDYNRKGKLLF